MNGTLSCPSCGFSKKTDPARIPVRSGAAVCPKCGIRFPVGPGVSGVLSPPVPENGTGLSSPPAGDRYRPEDSGRLPGTPLRLAADLIRSPYRVFATRGIDRGTPGGMFSFGLLFGSLGTMLAVFWQFAAAAWRFAPEASAVLLLGLGAGFMLCIVLAPLWVASAMVVNAVVLHMCLLLVGAGRGGLGATFRVVSFSQAAKLLALLPFVGVIAAVVWQLTIQAIGLREAHGISSLRLLLAAAVPAGLISLLAAAVSSAV